MSGSSAILRSVRKYDSAYAAAVPPIGNCQTNPGSRGERRQRRRTIQLLKKPRNQYEGDQAGAPWLCASKMADGIASIGWGKTRSRRDKRQRVAEAPRHAGTAPGQ